MKLCKYRILNIMLQSVRAITVLLPLNIIAIWITPNRKEDVYHKTDFNSMRRPLVLYSCTEKSMIQNQSKSIDELWKSEIHEIRNKFIPKQLRWIPSWKTKGSVPIHQVLCDAIWNKSKLHRQWILSKNVLNDSDAEDVRRAYTKARIKVKAMIRKSKREFEKSIGIQSKSSRKIFWSHVFSKLKTKTGVTPVLQDEKDERIYKMWPQKKANILQKQFVSVFTKELNAEVPLLDKKTDANL